MTTETISLKHILFDRERMQSDGWRLIQHLVKAFHELQKAKATLYKINPSNIFVNPDFSQVLLVGVDKVAFHDRLRYSKFNPGLPYSNKGTKGYELEPEVGYHWDMWSLGVVILEVIIGPDVVEMMDSDEKVRAVLRNTKYIIPNDLLDLIEKMTIFVDKPEAQRLMKKTEIFSEENISHLIKTYEDQRRYKVLNGCQLLEFAKYKYEDELK